MQAQPNVHMQSTAVAIQAQPNVHMQHPVAAHEHATVAFVRLRTCRNTKLPWMIDTSVSSRHVSRLSWCDANSELDCTLTSCARMPELAGADTRSAFLQACSFNRPSKHAGACPRQAKHKENGHCRKERHAAQPPSPLP